MYRYPTTFNNITSTDNNPGYTPAPLLSDEAFFGAWDGEKWVRRGLFKYNAHPGLKPVEEHARRGEYEAAAEALLAYFRSRKTSAPSGLPDVNEHTRFRAELFMDQVYMLSPPLLQFEVTPTAQHFVLDVTDPVRNGQGRFMLTSRHKGEAAAVFNSRKAAEHPPRLQLRIAGKDQIVEPTADTTLQYGSGSLGDHPELVVRGSKPGTIVDNQTSRAYLRFVLSGVDVKTIEKAELLLYGRSCEERPVQVLLSAHTQAPLEAANEKTLVWDDVNHQYFSYQGLDGLQAWRNPETGNPHGWFFVTAIVRFPYYPSIVTTYLATGDERYARRAIQIYLDYVQYQMFNRLDSGVRVGNLIRPSMALYKSPSMTPQALKIMLEHAWRLGNWFETQEHWYRDHNYGSSYIVGLSGLASLFPEFRDASKWWKRTHERALYYTTSGMFFPDHSFKEGDTGYGTMVVNSLNQYRRTAIESGIDLPDPLIRNFLGIARYAMDVSDPDGMLYPYGDTYTPRQYDKGMIRDIATEHNDPELLYIATDGREGRRPDRTSVWYPDSLLGIMRTAWADQNALGLFVNARNGGAHCHPNTLSLCAYGYGRQLIDDTYFASSDASDPRGRWVRENTRAHNTVEISGQRQHCGRESGAADGWMIFNPRFDLFDGYTDATPGFRHRRRILLVKPSGFWIVSDRLEARAAPAATHIYTQAWHPRPDSQVLLQGKQKVAATRYPSKGNIKIVPADPETLTAELANGFWVLDANTYVTYEKSVQGDTTFDTVLYPMPEREDAGISVTRLPTGTDTLTSSALRLDIKNESGAYTGLYYLSYEEQPGERTVGSLTTDARMAYVEYDQNNRLALLVLEQGSFVRQGECTILESETPTADLAIEWHADAKTIRISADAFKEPTSINVFSPFSVESVMLNEEARAYSQHDSIVTIKMVSQD